MKAKNQFSFQRIGLLIRNDIQRTYQLSGIVAAAILLVLFVLLYQSLSGNAPTSPNSPLFNHNYLLKSHFDYFPLFLMIGGLLFTDYAFAGLLTRPQCDAFLALPASNLEKTTAKWILTALIFPLVALLLYQLFAVISGWFVHKSLGLQLVELPLFDAFVWNWILAYISLQSIFFLGAMSLGRLAAFKTILILVALFAFSSLLSSASLSLLLPHLPFKIGFWGLAISDILPATFQVGGSSLGQMEDELAKYLLPVFLILLALSLLPISFLKFKEKEFTR